MSKTAAAELSIQASTVICEGNLYLPGPPTQDNHASTKGYLDTQLASVSIDSDNIVDGAVSTADLADSSVTSAKIANGSVREQELDSSLLSRLEALETQMQQVQTSDSSIPSGVIAFFASLTCPTGWTEYTALHGRYIVGSTGANQGTPVGTALNSGENRASGQHSHTANPPAASGSFTTNSAGSHTHSVNPPAATTSSRGAHTHGYNDYSLGNEGSHEISTSDCSDCNLGNRAKTTSSDGAHTHTLDIPSFNSGSNGAHEHTGSVNIDIPSFTTGTINIYAYVR